MRAVSENPAGLVAPRPRADRRRLGRRRRPFLHEGGPGPGRTQANQKILLHAWQHGAPAEELAWAKGIRARCAMELGQRVVTLVLILLVLLKQILISP